VCKFVSIVIGIVVVALFLDCSKQKLRLPIEEINRPLSLPPENWRIGIGAGPRLIKDHMSKTDMAIDPIFVYPYIQLGSKWEYYIPTIIKFYCAKNVEIKDSTLYARGTNCAMSAGLTGISYSQLEGTVVYFSGSINFKKSLTDRLWMTSLGSAYYHTHINTYGCGFNTGLGYQFSKHFYATFAPSLYYSNYRTLSDTVDVSGEKKINVIRIQEDNLTGVFPIVFGFNVTEKWSIYLITDYRLNIYNDIQIESVLGFSYSW
jgi:hypothetical protein